MKKTGRIILGAAVVLFGVMTLLAGYQAVQIFRVQSQIDETSQKIRELQEDCDGREKNNEELKGQLEKLKEDNEKTEAQIKAKTENKEQEKTSKTTAIVQSNGRKVAVDPGHQGYNVDMSGQEPLGPGSSEMKTKSSTGTAGKFTGVPEYELNLNISKQLRDELEQRGYEVMLTREDNDAAISNRERALLAADFGADIYVRIHANGSEDTSVSGAFTMVPSADNPYVGSLHDQSYALGEAVINAYSTACGIANKGVQLYDNMTGINWSSVPVIILEMGFMTNESDDTNMEDPNFQKLMVQGIANGIDDYFEAGN